ncbi:membrane cofactor protein-like [Trematomus bernacchii]|uniref:membrane cofactor protein-like n=1 Tax=Trematomus bernacchii TaxID=40690 RepID=UPI00146DA1C2|nr:membrane cofactor protein-like [Trematomus bernacchii]
MAASFLLLLTSVGLFLSAQGKSCGAIGDVPNGHVDFTEGIQFGDKLTVTCNPGLPTIGSFYPVKDAYEYREVIKFSCPEPFTLNGSNSLSCSETGVFQPAAPNCVEVECKEPVVEFGHWDSGSRGPYTHKATVTFKCNEGYRMITSATIICGINSRWEPELPKCEPVPAVQTTTTKSPESTKKPTAVTAVQTTTTKSPESTKKPTVKHCEPPVDPTIGSFSPVKDTYEYREVIQFSCPEPFTLNGSKSLSCSETGVFQPAAPKCVQVECKEPVVGFGHWESGSRGPYTHKATVTFKCNEGYRMTNSATIICGINSQWEPELPKCEDERGRTHRPPCRESYSNPAEW